MAALAERRFHLWRFSLFDGVAARVLVALALRWRFARDANVHLVSSRDDRNSALVSSPSDDGVVGVIGDLRAMQVGRVGVLVLWGVAWVLEVQWRATPVVLCCIRTALAAHRWASAMRSVGVAVSTVLGTMALLVTSAVATSASTHMCAIVSVAPIAILTTLATSSGIVARFCAVNQVGALGATARRQVVLDFSHSPEFWVVPWAQENRKSLAVAVLVETNGVFSCRVVEPAPQETFALGVGHATQQDPKWSGPW